MIAPRIARAENAAPTAATGSVRPDAGAVKHATRTTGQCVEECTVTSFYSGCHCSDCDGTADWQSCYVNSSDPVCIAEGFSLCWKEPGLTPNDAICTKSCTADEQCSPGSCHEGLDGAKVCIGYKN